MKDQRTQNIGFRSTRSERASYCLYFLGQNVFYGLIAINMQTFFSDVGITATSIAAILLITKLWDAINDPLLGIVIDKVRFRKGRFIPWLRISLPMIAISSVVFFMLPVSSSPLMKIIWATVAYIAWDMSYTLCDVPIFVLPMSMTDNIKERGQLLTMGRFFAMIGVIAASVALPMLQARIGWFAVGLIFTVVAVAVMIPLLFKGKERQIVRPEGSVTLSQMFRYVSRNRYLLIFYGAMLVSGLLYFAQYINIYFARYCLGNQDAASLISMLSMIPLLIVGGFIPMMIKKIDKYNLYIASNIGAAVTGIILFFVGYSNTMALYVLLFIQAIFTGTNNILLFTFTPDCLEYGTYHTGERAEGTAASVQTFFTKLVGSLSGPIAMLLLAGFGFVAGENAVQPAAVSQGLWILYTLCPAFGIGMALVLLRFYKLRVKDVQVMAQYNNQEITKEEAESQLLAKYGPAAELVKMTTTGVE